MSYPSRLNAQARRLVARAPKGLLPFLSVGVAGLAVHTAVFTVLYKAGVDKRLAWLGALAVASGVTWVLNRRLTFTPTGRKRSDEIMRYALVTLVAQGISFSVFLATGHFAPWLAPPLCVIVGAGVATLFSYSGQRFFTFAALKSGHPEAVPEVEAAMPDLPII